MLAVSSYIRPHTIAQALEILAHDEFIPLAGGTDLLVALRHTKKQNLMDIGRLGLDFVKHNDDQIEIGAAVTHQALTENEIIGRHLPLLADAAATIGTWQIRNRGTIGGNIANASPCADTAPALLNYQAQIVLISKSGQRTVPLGEFITGPYQTQRRPDELLHSFICPKHPADARYHLIKLGRRQAVNISRLTLAVMLVTQEDGLIREAMIASGSVLPIPARLTEIEQMLKGKKPSIQAFQEAAVLAGEFLVKRSGYRWSTPYKQPVLIGLLKRALCRAAGITED